MNFTSQTSCKKGIFRFEITDHLLGHKMCADGRRSRITIGQCPGMRVGAVETAENGCGGAGHWRQLRYLFGGRYVMCFDFLVDLSSEVLDKNIVIFVIDVALSNGGGGFGWLLPRGIETRV